MELRLLFSAHCLIMIYISNTFHENISKGFRIIERTRNNDANFQKDIIPLNVDGVTVLNLCILSDDASYFYQVP